MGFWKKRSEGTGRKGLALIALQGVTHEQLAEETLAELVAYGEADRIGVWLEPESDEVGGKENVFRGAVWDRESETTPREWRTISPHAVFPLTRLLSGLTVETNPTENSSQPLVGPLAGLHSASWVPVQHAGKLRGILMAGWLSQNRSWKKEQLQRVAAELAMALAFETERRLARERHSDIALCNQVLASLRNDPRPEELLQKIVESCVSRSSQQENAGAQFALIGELRKMEGTDGAAELKVLYSAEPKASGRFMQAEVVQKLVRQALALRRTVGNEIGPSAGNEEILRAVAVPLESGEGSGTVLIAGFLPGSASLGSIERMELRGRLAAQVLATLREGTQETRRRMREEAILEASDNPMVVLGPEGSITASNRAARVLLLSSSALENRDSPRNISSASLRKQFSEFFRVSDRERIAAWQKSQRSRQPNAEEDHEAELDSGARVKLRSQTGGEESHAIALLPVAAPVSVEETRAQAELLCLSEWLDHGVILFDTEDNVRLLNLRFAQLTGMAPGEAEKYKTLESLVQRLQGQSAQPESFAQHWRELAKRDAEREREEIHLLRPVARVLERASRPVFDLAGNRLGRIELYRDLTAQRMFQANLLQTERLAALGQMISGVAHELSNPLTSILGYAQRLLIRKNAGDDFEEIRRIFAEAERAGAILRRMLLASRESTPERKPVPLNAIVQRTIELQRFSLAAERIRVEVQLEADLPQVMGDAGQLQQVLMNLLGNARQAIESQGQGGTIRVRTKRTEDNRVRLEVTDSGPGIPESILSRIFDPFFTTKPAGVGTGLGLSIVLSLVREHGGQVYVQSPRGSGAEFIVELPMAAQKDLTGRVQINPSEETRFSGQPAHNYASFVQGNAARRVLVVEDEPTVAQLISDVLRDEGFEIEVHLDGRDAAEHAANEAFDLIICDMKMPNLDGQSLYESFKRSKRAAQKRFLFVTGDVLGAKTQEFLRKNQLPHLAKPFRVEELLEKVHQLLQPAGHADSGRATPLRKNTATTG